MKRNKLLISTFIFFYFGFFCVHAQDSHTDIIPSGSILQKLSSNQFVFTEAPVWFGDSVLLFVDDGIQPPNVFKYNPIRNQISVFRNYSVNYNGLACDKAGNLLACESKVKQVVRMNKTAEVTKVLTSGYNRSAYNGPNDLIADDKGGVYFTDPVFSGTGVQDKNGVYYIDSTGNVKRIIEELAAPNGVILSPDGKKLYVDDSNNKYLCSWDVAPDGSVSGKLNFALIKTSGGNDSNSDGLAIDIYGNIYVTAENGVQIFSPQGVAITTILVPGGASNCDFGGKDFKTLYITSWKNLYSIDLNYPGYAVSRLTTAINSFSNKSQVKIYPNPVQGVLHIDIPGKTGAYEVFDITGKSLLQKVIHENNASIDVSEFKKGIYFVKVQSENQMFTGKFVKQ